jgi:hypothetical protein
MEIQKWLLTNNCDFERLEEEFSIKSRLYKDRVVLNYNQIGSTKHDEMTKECRALILGYPNVEKILSRSFDRFFNYGEDPKTNDFDITKATIYEKCDGSLINIYHDGKKLCIATRSMAFAEGETVHGPTYAELVERCKPHLMNALEHVFSPQFLIKNTLIFELCTQENRVVKQYDGDKLFLLAVRDKINGEYYTDSEVDMIAYRLQVQRPEEFHLNSYEAIIREMKNLPALDEGYVCNWDGWRIKIKNPSYLAVAHLRENGIITPKRIAVLVMEEDEQEYLLNFPEDKKFFDPYTEAYLKFKQDLNMTWLSVKDIEDQKEFALKVKDLPISGFMFMFKKGMNYQECYDRMSDNKKLEMLNRYL